MAAILSLFLAELGARVYLFRKETNPKLVQYKFQPSVIREREEKIGEFGLLPPTPLKFVETRQEYFYQRPFSSRLVTIDLEKPLHESPEFDEPVEVYRGKLIAHGEVIFDVTYTKDKFGRRVTPGESKKDAERFLILLGDSNLFGFGLQDRETISYFLGRQNGSVRVYNYGMNGLFPGEALDSLRKIKGQPEISEKRGTILYFWADYYMYRNMLSLSQLNWSLKKPYYYEREDGEIVAEKTVEEVWPLWSLIASIYHSSALINLLQIDWPRKPTTDDYEFMTNLISQVKREGKRLGADQFYVVFYPLSRSLLRHGLIPHLEKAGIRYIDYGDLPIPNMVKGRFRIPYDGHFTREVNEAFANEISRLEFLFEDARQPY